MNIKEGILLTLHNNEGNTPTEIYKNIKNQNYCPRLGGKGKTPIASVSTQCISLFNENKLNRKKNENKRYVYFLKKMGLFFVKA